MTLDALRRLCAQLDAHDVGARLRLYDWLVIDRTLREACQPFIDALTLGGIGWPVIYAEALDVKLHFDIDRALPLVRLR